jgi:hypothetical protein
MTQRGKRDSTQPGHYGVSFSEAQVRALCDHAVAIAGLMPSVKLELILWKSDFDAFARLGKPITGATWVKGTWERPVYIRELGPDWFQGYIKRRCGRLATAMGRAVAWLIAVRMAVQ